MADEVREYNVDISWMSAAELPLIAEGGKAPGGITAWVAMIAKCVGKNSASPFSPVLFLLL